MPGANSGSGGSPGNFKELGGTPQHVFPNAVASRRPSLLKTQSYSGSTNKGLNTFKRNNVQGSAGSSAASSVNNSLENTPTVNSAVLTPTGSSNSNNASTNGNQPWILQLGRTRSRSLSQYLAQHNNNQTQYFAQEKGYLKKIRNQAVDDYYTKGIKGTEDDIRDSDLNDDEEDELDNADGTGGLLADMDDDKYEIDFSLVFSMMRDFNKDIKLSPAKAANGDAFEDPSIIERLEWQSMLVSVLTGDVVKSERTKIINNNNPENEQEFYLHAAYKDDLWFGIKSKLLNRTEDDHRKIILYRRTLVDHVFDEILKYEISYENPKENSPRSQVIDILDRYDKVCGLWKTSEDMRHDKPICRSEEFQNRIDALVAWLTITDAIKTATKTLSLWIGNDELDISKSPVQQHSPSPSSPSTASSKVVKEIFDEDNKSLAERLMKEKDVDTIFQKRIFIPLAPWMIKAKKTYLELGHMFESLKLPDYIYDLIQICIIPMKLIKEIIKVRLGYAVKLQNPTLMMIDQMIDDFKSYLSIALEVKLGVDEYCKPDPERRWILSDLFESENLDFDKVVLQCVRYFLFLLNKKLLGSSNSSKTFRTFKEPEELEETWNYLKLLGAHIEGASTVVAQETLLITLKLIHRLLIYFNYQITSSPTHANISDLVRWYTSTTENFGQMRRKLARFTGEIARDFTNSLIFDLPTAPGNKMKTFLEVLKASNHFLVYTGSIESKGTYFFASPDLSGKGHEILKIINGSYVGVDPNGTNLKFVDLLRLFHESDDFVTIEDDEFSISSMPYVVAICPPKPIVWDGSVIPLNIEDVPVTGIQVGQMLLITKAPYYNVHVVRDRFLDIVEDVLLVGGVVKPVEQICSLDKVYSELKKINRVYFKMTLSVLDSVAIVRDNSKEAAPEGGFQELVNNYFIFARGYGKNSVKNLDSTKKSIVIMKLIHLSIDWVSFICDDCIPTDRKTFRWCVLALEFAMDMTRGFNVLTLSNELFYNLKFKVSRCMSLLISHFDIMGARSSEAEKRKLLKWSSQRKEIENTADDEYIMKAYREDVMNGLEEIEDYRRELNEENLAVGRVLDATDLEYQFVTLLASSFSSVSIRWQKGKFIGGGTSGSVYAAVNLDTGGVMAVKDIRFHDSQSIKNIVPAIKDEMTVLEILNHPNIVQYFGVEVHRDKVYIFMEFCEGGSLASLLSHGRIEDEMVIQVYTLQMLEGIAYLHQSGVVHRDIKPENVLLDHNGVIKFVDFGAAKVIATSGRTRAGTRSSISSRPMNNNNNKLNSMIGTPMYMSPEVITGASTDKDGAVDIWSLGCCVLEMATGRRPWANLDNEWAIMYHIAAGHKPQLPSSDQLSEAGIKFLSRCLEHDPNKRPSAVELLNDPWIVSIRQAAFGSSESGSTPSSEISSDN